MVFDSRVGDLEKVRAVYEWIKIRDHDGARWMVDLGENCGTGNWTR